VTEPSPAPSPHAPGAAITPEGGIRLTAGESGLDGGLRARVSAAAARGAGYALLELGAAAVSATLEPALGFLRDVGKAFVTRLAATPDLEELRAKVTVEPDGDELDALARATPPMPGGEYVSRALLDRWWDEMGAAFRDEIRAHEGSVAAWLAARAPAWSVVGRVCFHLAENRGDAEHPFAFLATFAHRVSQRRVQHVRLAHALEESAARKDRRALLTLLEPVSRAARASRFVAELLDSGEIYEAVAWTPEVAHRFLRDLPLMEAAGLTVRVPDWWRARRPPRPEVQVKIGGAAPPGGRLDGDALLDFDVSVTLDGEELGAAEVQALLAAEGSLVPLRGRWVELDRARLAEVLAHWTKVEAEAREGLSFLEGLRLLAGAPLEVDAEGGPAARPGRVTAGPWLAAALAALRSPEGITAAEPGPALRAELRPYQRTGVRWLWQATRLGMGVCLADDMGLGKTVQVIALLVLAKERRERGEPPHLLVVPASLVGNWQEELERFAPDLRVLVAHPSAMERVAEPPPVDEVDVVLTTYGQATRVAWLAARAWSLVVLDEAQAIKNPGAQKTRAVKELRARARVALTGTPVENRLGDLWSLFDFLDPGLLGSPREFGALAKRMASSEGGYAPLRRLLEPYLLRRLKRDVAADLPPKTEMKAFCRLAPRQAALYQRAIEELRAELGGLREGIERRGRILAYLVRLKQICNHPDQWLGERAWKEEDSGKLGRLREIAEEIADRGERALVFTQFREATEPLAARLGDVFGRPGLVLTGETPVRRRAELVKEFQRDGGPPFFVLSVKAGGTGLNLTAASHVVHFDRWWNPAVEDQATDRAHRIGQGRSVLVHKLVCRGTVEERIDALIEGKQGLLAEVVAGGGEARLSEMNDEELLRMVALDLRRAVED
jgi:superfamily II DNA or RNA helicase